MLTFPARSSVTKPSQLDLRRQKQTSDESDEERTSQNHACPRRASESSGSEDAPVLTKSLSHNTTSNLFNLQQVSAAQALPI